MTMHFRFPCCVRFFQPATKEAVDSFLSCTDESIKNQDDTSFKDLREGEIDERLMVAKTKQLI